MIIIDIDVPMSFNHLPVAKTYYISATNDACDYKVKGMYLLDLMM